MPSTTVNMGLIKWSSPTDPYDHTQLSGNFQVIDEHDHTSGKGKRLPGAALESEAINTPQLKDASVTNAKLAGDITADKLGPGIVNSLGDFKWWWRPNTSTPLPEAGWVIAAGQTLSAANHEFPGGGSIILPNLIGRFAYGVESPSIGISGGVASINLAHAHNVNPHQHAVPPHTHPIGLESGFNAQTNLKISQDLSGDAWVHSDDHFGAEHRHSINGSVGATGVTTEGATATTDAQLGTQSILPPYVGLLPLLKVKNS